MEDYWVYGTCSYYIKPFHSFTYYNRKIYKYEKIKKNSAYLIDHLY